MTPLYPRFGRNDRRILAQVCAATGQGYSALNEPNAPVGRLVKAGLLEWRGYVRVANVTLLTHTASGLAVWRALEAPAP